MYICMCICIYLHAQLQQIYTFVNTYIYTFTCVSCPNDWCPKMSVQECVAVIHTKKDRNLCIYMNTYVDCDMCPVVTHVVWVATISRLNTIIGLFCRYSLFSRALLKRRPMILRSLLIVATPYIYMYREIRFVFRIHHVKEDLLVGWDAYAHTYIYTYGYMHIHVNIYIYVHIYIYVEREMLLLVGWDICTHTYVYA